MWNGSTKNKINLITILDVKMKQTNKQNKNKLGYLGGDTHKKL